MNWKSVVLAVVLALIGIWGVESMRTKAPEAVIAPTPAKVAVVKAPVAKKAVAVAKVAAEAPLVSTVNNSNEGSTLKKEAQVSEKSGVVTMVTVASLKQRKEALRKSILEQQSMAR